MKNSGEKVVYFITGASGVGKTTLVEGLKKKYENMPWAFLHFDSIGVPSIEEMKKEFGSPARWQEVKTNEWIDRIVRDYDNEKVFLEGQVNLQFIYTAFQKNNFANDNIVHLDCNENEMAHRLIHKRNQPGLFNSDMRNWLMFLRSQATELRVPIVDTSTLSEQEVLRKFEVIVGL